ncbi:MAG: Lrp/AsnC ligand binding domain-containing protein, partial [Lentisphaeria bacterium]|nr:Lrp/AsnC ligand binding domain-containing protein [Lentisphaeria bacterium]
ALFPEVVRLDLVSGSYDLLLEVEGDSLQQVASFVSARLSTIEGVLSTATLFQLKTYKEAGVIIVGEENDERLLVSP